MKRFYAIMAALSLLVACGKESGGTEDNGGTQGGGSESSELYDKEGATVKGYVRCGEDGVADVVVSDGVNVTATDSFGRYWLPSDVASTDFIMISIPSGYEVASDGTYSLLPMFYRTCDKSAKSVQRFDFELTKVDNDNYTLLVFADMHLSGRDPSKESFSTSNEPLDYTQYTQQLVPSAKAYAANISTPVYGINLGDMTHSQYWYSANASFEQYLDASKDLGFQMFNVIGNHDHDHKRKDDYGAGERFRKWLGPTYYSFNLGRQHYIALDNMVCIDGDNHTNYAKLVDDVQMEWMKKDLAAMDPSVEDVVILCHVAFASWKTSGATTNVLYNKMMSNFDELASLLSKYNVRILSGHAHFSQTFRINERMIQHTHPSICGTWWYDLLCCDGSPAAYTAYRFVGNNCTRRAVPFGKYANRKYTLYDTGVTTRTGYCAVGETQADETTGYAPAILINCWEWSPEWTFKVFENGVDMSSRGEMVWRCDLDHRRMSLEEGIVPYSRYSWLKTYRNLHMFQYAPSDPSAKITVTATDEDGKPRFVIDNITLKK
ncbi:MAG: calcineurin-like phosphoesterase C-terminal domain-containing protein [Alistipes sp.]|nr:calcineurin-like phosphoesterase C-terminal domain-containing protein [Alistipes sp.]